MDRFNKQTDMDAPINEYYSKQEECQEIAEDMDVKVTDKMMVQKLTTHMGKTWLVWKSNYKFKNQALAKRDVEEGQEVVPVDSC